ncbi:hypothetical protein PROFUN_15713, partial [Planoprotostelium fungivorum]
GPLLHIRWAQLGRESWMKIQWPSYDIPARFEMLQQSQKILLVSGRHVTSLCQQSLNVFAFLPLYSWCMVLRRVRSRDRTGRDTPLSRSRLDVKTETVSETVSRRDRLCRWAQLERESWMKIQWPSYDIPARFEMLQQSQKILLVSGRHVTSLCQQSLNVFAFLPLYSWCVVLRRVRSRDSLRDSLETRLSLQVLTTNTGIPYFSFPTGVQSGKVNLTGDCLDVVTATYYNNTICTTPANITYLTFFANCYRGIAANTTMKTLGVQMSSTLTSSTYTATSTTTANFAENSFYWAYNAFRCRTYSTLRSKIKS